MGVLRIILTVIYILICIALVVLVLMQACGRVYAVGGRFKPDFVLKYS